MDIVLLIVLVALVVMNWVIYHKIFDVYYWDLGKGLLKEIVGCVLVAVMELGLLLTAGSWLLSLVGGVLLWIIKAILWIVIGVLAIALISVVVKFIKDPKATKEWIKDVISNKNEKTVNNTEKESEEEKTTENTEETSSQEKMSEEEIKEYIMKNFSVEEKVKAIQFYRSKTGAGLKESKEYIDSLFAQ